MKIYNYLIENIKQKGAVYLILLDPDKIHNGKIKDFVECAEKSGVDGFLIGSSLMLNNDFEEFVIYVKSKTKLPAIIFPGAVDQLSSKADAILYISVISGRNAEHLIGKHILSAPLIKRTGIEPISTGYILVESGTSTAAQYMSGSFPVPRNKPEIAAATALAAEYMGMKFIYLEAGSGAQYTVPDEMVKIVSSYCSIPVIVGGGIKSPEEASDKVKNGAKVVVTGNFFEDEKNWVLIKDFAESVHHPNTV